MHVRRGAKVIRRRRSLATVNDAGQTLAGQGSETLQAIPPTMRNPQSVGSGGSIVARLKLNGIDGMPPQGVEHAA